MSSVLEQLKGDEFPSVGWKKVQDGRRFKMIKYDKTRLKKDEYKKLTSYPHYKVSVLEPDEKLLWFYHQMLKLRKRYKQSEPTILLIDRSYIIRDSMEQLSSIPDIDIRQDVKISFIDEPARDAGGLLREWLYCVIDAMLEPKFNMFAYKKNAAYIIPPLSSFQDYKQYYFCGQIIGKALYERIPLQLYLNRVIYKQILRRDVDLEDMYFYDADIYNSLKFMSTATITVEHGFTYSIMVKNQCTGEHNIVDLKPDGSTIQVTDSNKNEFISLVYYPYQSEVLHIRQH